MNFDFIIDRVRFVLQSEEMLRLSKRRSKKLYIICGDEDDKKPNFETN